MEFGDMVKLLEYRNDKILLDSVDLIKLTNMFFLTQYDFLLLMRMYFRNNVRNINKNNNRNNCEYIINVREKDIYNKDDLIYKIRYIVEGEVFVSKDSFEYYKKEIFNFAYSKCSSIADNPLSTYILKEGNELQAQNLMEEECNTYSCFYRSSGKVWNYLVSNVKIDEEEKEKMYNLLNSLSKKEKTKVLKI